MAQLVKVHEMEADKQGGLGSNPITGNIHETYAEVFIFHFFNFFLFFLIIFEYFMPFWLFWYAFHAY